MIRLFLCDARRQIRSTTTTKKLLMAEEILCVVQWRKAQHTKTYVSIYAASKVQNLPARTIFYSLMMV